MTTEFSSYRTYTTRFKHDLRRRRVYEFKTPRGVITLMERLMVSRSQGIRIRIMTHYFDSLGRHRVRLSRPLVKPELKRQTTGFGVNHRIRKR
jgi:hypothetical protein